MEEKLAREISEENFENVCRGDIVKIVSLAEGLGFKSDSEIDWFTVTNYKYPSLMQRADVKKLVEDVEIAALERQFKVEEAIWGIKADRGD